MTRQVTLVCGPPCAGKNWYVKAHAARGDLILDLDQLARDAGSTVAHNHDGSHFGRAQKRFDELCSRIAADPNAAAWVIRCAPEPGTRTQLAMTMMATRTVLLLPDKETAYWRAAERAGDLNATCKAISRWYRRYRPAPLDEVVPN